MVITKQMKNSFAIDIVLEIYLYSKSLDIMSMNYCLDVTVMQM